MKPDKTLDEQFGEYIWCDLCGFVYSAAAWAAVNNTCPNCGAGLMNARPWAKNSATQPEISRYTG